MNIRKVATAALLVLTGTTLGAATPTGRPVDLPGKPATTADRPFTRATATGVIARARRIVSPNGIERLEKVRIGGIDQWVSARGVDRRNPVLVFVHGGPGYASIPTSWWIMQGWDEYFTVVQWDQRATGKTHLETEPSTVAPTLTSERMITDAEEIVAWSRRTFGKRKVFLMGHSYGSFLGVQVARRHPEWLYAYIGVGQVTDMMESERRGWRFALDAARADRNAAAISELEAIAPYAAPGSPPDNHDLQIQRRWVAHYGGTMAWRDGLSADSDLAELSPDYTDADLKRQWEGNDFSTPILFPQLLRWNRVVPDRLDVPLFLFEGRRDTHVSAELAAEWLARVRAPSKRLVWFERSAHMVMTEEPGKALVSLVRYVRPIAGRVGDVAPESSP